MVGFAARVLAQLRKHASVQHEVAVSELECLRSVRDRDNDALFQPRSQFAPKFAFAVRVDHRHCFIQHENVRIRDDGSS